MCCFFSKKNFYCLATKKIGLLNLWHENIFTSSRLDNSTSCCAQKVIDKTVKKIRRSFIWSEENTADKWSVHPFKSFVKTVVEALKLKVFGVLPPSFLSMTHMWVQTKPNKTKSNTTKPNKIRSTRLPQLWMRLTLNFVATFPPSVFSSLTYMPPNQFFERRKQGQADAQKMIYWIVSWYCSFLTVSLALPQEQK